MTVPLSVLILTRNEEVNIRQALASVCGWADQTFIVDSYSTDKTVEIARDMGAEVFQKQWPGYAAQKNWALDNLPFRNEWVFILDADEFLSDELKSEIAQTLAAGGNGYDGFYVKWRLIFYGQWIKHSGWYPGWGLRFFKHKLGRYENRPVDEHIILNGRTGECKNDIVHRDLHDMAYWIDKHIRYAQLNAQAYSQLEQNEGADERIRPTLFGSQAQRRRFIKERVWRHLPARGVLYFLYLYVLRFGFLDGGKGLIFCMMHGIFEEFKVVMQWERRHIHELGSATAAEGKVSQSSARSSSSSG
jgi:glycosyltransferase involved in cell wall biosynthesis